jgi:protein ImuB
LLLQLSLERPHRDRQRRAEAAGRATRPDDGRLVTLTVQTAEPLLDEVQWLDLLRLRLETTQLAARVERLTLQAELVAASAHQLRLWQLLAEAGGAGRRDPEAAAQALARVRAALGDAAVVAASLQPVHMPEAQARWQPLSQPGHPKPSPTDGDPPLLRRLLATPQVLPSRPKHEPDGWLLADWRQGAVTRLWGPFRLSGGWWAREVRRDYWFVQTERGDLLWVFYDQVRRLWYLQGGVD